MQMKQLRAIVCVALALALTCLAMASTASATILEVGGAGKNESVTIKASLKSSTSTLLTDTAGFFLNTCTASTLEGKTEGAFSGTTVGGKVSALSFSSCKESPIVVDEPGSLSVEWISGTTNGTVRSIN